MKTKKELDEAKAEAEAWEAAWEAAKEADEAWKAWGIAKEAEYKAAETWRKLALKAAEIKEEMWAANGFKMGGGYGRGGRGCF